MEPIAVIGGGGHAKVLLGILGKLKRYRVIGYTDLKDQGNILRATYLGMDQELVTLTRGGNALAAVLAVGQTALGRQRQELWSRLEKLPLSFPSVVSPDAIVNEGVTVAEATVVMDGVVINCGATIGRGTIVNTQSTIEHDVAIAEWVHVAPGATICGGSKIGRYSLIGAGATVIHGITITEGCLVGAGATVVRDLLEAGVYVGCPAHRID